MCYQHKCNTPCNMHVDSRVQANSIEEGHFFEPWKGSNEQMKSQLDTKCTVIFQLFVRQPEGIKDSAFGMRFQLSKAMSENDFQCCSTLYTTVLLIQQAWFSTNSYGYTQQFEQLLSFSTPYLNISTGPAVTSTTSMFRHVNILRIEQISVC